MRLPATVEPTTERYTSSAWSQRVGPLTALPALIRALGAEPAPILAAAGVRPEDLDDPGGRVPYAAVVRLLRVAADGTGCSHLGLLAGRMWRLSDLGVVGDLVRNCPTVGDALRTLTCYQQLNSSGGLAFLIDNGPTVDLGYGIYHPDVTGAGQMYDCVLAGALNFLRELCGPGWAPAQVLLPHAAPADRSHHRRLFKSDVCFDAEFAAIRFPRAWLDHPVEGCDAARYRRALEQVGRMRDEPLVPQVLRTLRRILLEGMHSGDEVANMLSLHRRTLNRRLKSAGTTFRKLLDQVRYDVARQLLVDSNVSLDDIAATLGYAEVGSFMRSFRRWAGTTPARWRRAGVAQRVIAQPRAWHAPHVHSSAGEGWLAAGNERRLA